MSKDSKKIKDTEQGKTGRFPFRFRRGRDREIVYHLGEKYWDQKGEKGSFYRGIRMIIILILGGISIGAVALFMGATEYPGLFPEYFLRPGTMILNTLPATLILFLLYIIINRAGWSYAITYVLVVGLSFIDYYKIKLRDDPLVFADIDLISEAADISSRYTLSIVWQVVLAIALGILGTWLMHMFAKTRLVRSPLNILSVLIIVALAGGAYSLVYINTDVYAESGESDVVGQWSDKEKYVSR